MKVLFFTKYPIEGASSRYRVFQYLPTLRELGIDCTVSSFMDTNMYQTTFSHGSFFTKTWLLVKAVCRRMLALQKSTGYDLVFMQRELLPFGPPWGERWLRRRGVKMIFDYDDALFIPQPSKFTPLATRLRSGNRILQIFGLVDCVLAGNSYLAEAAEPYCANTRVFEVAEDTKRFEIRSKPADNGHIVIGWLGSWSTEKYLDSIKNALTTVLDKYPLATLHVVGGGDFLLPTHTVKHHEWSLENETRLVSSFDIGIMPLPLEDWSRGKSGGKARTYMAAGIPVVCTAIGYNKDLVENAHTGFLVEAESEWVRALSNLIENPGLRQRLGSAAQKHIAANFSVASKSRELATILSQVARQPGKGNG